MIKFIHTFEQPTDNKNSIFLAGPTYRISETTPWTPPSWRGDAVTFLTEMGFDGDVFVPEWRDNKKPVDWTYSRQVNWEDDNLKRAKIILFWIPRDMVSLPGLTTNVEFGEWMKSGKVVAGAPPTAENIRYIRDKASRNGIPWSETMEGCVKNALEMLNKQNGDATHIWFTSDTHFGHARTLELSKRPFMDVFEMDWSMVANWNRLVGDEDSVYHLGDFGDPYYLKHLKGKYIYFLPGNYDKPDILEAMKKDERVRIIPNNTGIILNDSKFYLIHEPEFGDAADPKPFYLYGHIHKLQMIKRNGLNVGVDCHHFKPINKDTVLFYENAILNHYDKNAFMTIGDVL